MISSPGLHAAGSAYTDFGALRAQPGSSGAALEQAATQFESMFLDMLLSSMRDAGAVFRDGNYLSSPAVDVHQQMLDHQWAVHLSESGGIGLKEVLVRQLGDAASSEPDAAAEVPERATVNPTIRTQGRRAALFESARAFVSDLLPVAREVLGNTPVSPVLALAQSALETGWGSQIIHNGAGAPSFNLFGIKANGWSGESVEITTLENRLGRMAPERASFRAYDDVRGAFEDYLGLLEANPRYRAVLAAEQDPRAFGAALVESGYATDPRYAEKLERVHSRLAGLIDSIQDSVRPTALAQGAD